MDNQLYEACVTFRKTFEICHQEMSRFYLRESFPKGCCLETAIMLGVYLKSQGFGIWKRVHGEKYFGDKYKSHVWLERNGIVCDVTLDQFLECHYPEVFVGKKEEYPIQWEKKRA